MNVERQFLPFFVRYLLGRFSSVVGWCGISNLPDIAPIIASLHCDSYGTYLNMVGDN